MYVKVIELDGVNLTVYNLMKIGNGELRVKVNHIIIYFIIISLLVFLFVQMSNNAWDNIKRCRKVVDDFVASNKG